MPFTTEVIERLARHYFLTPTHVQQAAQLFDSYTQDDATASDAEARISAKQLQQLLVALGEPLSQQDIVETLHLFSTTAIPFSSAALPTATPTTATAAASAAPPATAAAVAAGTASRSVAPASSRRNNTGKRGNAAPAATVAAVAGGANKPSSRRTTSAPPTTATDGAGHASSPPGDLPSSASTLLTSTTRPITSADHAADEERHHHSNNNSLSASAVAVQGSAVNLHGMTFPAFLYFLLVYPTLVHHIFRHTSSMSAGPTTTVFTAMNVAELFSLLDSDGDGVCSAQDVRRVAERCATDYDGLLIDDPDLCRLAEMHPVELEEAIREFDVDGDGVVTLADLQHALQY